MKEMILRIWKKWFGKKAEQVVNLKQKQVSPMLEKLEKYLFKEYDFRFNVLTEQTEYRKKGEGVFHMVDQRVLNTLCMKARKQGINCWDKDVSRLLLSEQIPDFHPFTEYADSLPEWDGVDRVSELARRVSDEALWVSGFHRWMLGMVAQWMNWKDNVPMRWLPCLSVPSR